MVVALRARSYGDDQISELKTLVNYWKLDSGTCEQWAGEDFAYCNGL